MKSKDTEKIIRAIAKLTGINEDKINKYGPNPRTILERPNTISPTTNQLNKINALNDLIINYNITKYFSKEEAIRFNSIKDINNYFIKLLGRYKDKERMYVAFLDKNNQVIDIKKVSEGSIGSASVYPREILKEILKYNPKSIFICHNHPSGDTSPSRPDVEMTRRLKNIVEPLGIKLMDSIIVGEESYTSLKETGIVAGSSDSDTFISNSLDKNSRSKTIYEEHLNNYINSLSQLTGVSGDKLKKVAEAGNKKYDVNINNISRLTFDVENSDNISGIGLTIAQAGKIKELQKIIKNQDVFNKNESINNIKITRPHLLEQDDLRKRLLDGKEGIMTFYLDKKSNIISIEDISKVNINGNLELDPRTLLKNTLAHEASSILAVQRINNQKINSVAFQGEQISQSLFNIFNPLSIKVLDYIIVDQTKEKEISLLGKGLLPYSQFGMANYNTIEIKRFNVNGYDEEHNLEDFETEELDFYEME